MRSQHMNIGLICDICGKVLRCIKELKAHKEIHNVDLTVKCLECDLMFTSTIKMKYHWENVHNPGQFICEICSKSYTTKPKLHKHRYEAHTEKNFRCHRCGKGFIRNGELTNHMLWHEGKWKPKRQNRSTQNKEKIYKCELCDMRTARAYNLKKHVRHVHLGEKRLPKNPQDFYCSICQKSFSEARNYKKHMSRKSVHLLYKCDKCPQEILGLPNFRTHKKDHP
jgi:KRAB domain-containing zinc finger protein